MRVAWMGVTIVLMPVAAMAEPTSLRLAIRLAPTAHIPIPNIKPASRAPRTRRDQPLNASYKKLQDAVRVDAKDMGQSPEVQFGYLKERIEKAVAGSH